MTLLKRLQIRIPEEQDETILLDCLDSAKAAIMSRRFPYGNWPDAVEPQYRDLQYRIALDLYYKDGAQGQLAHSENGISRTYESSWISDQLLSEITPYCGTTK